MVGKGSAAGERRRAPMAAVGAVLIGLSSWLVVASPGHAGLAGSKHDFSSAAWSGGSSCGACHVPHRGDRLKTPKWGGPAAIQSAPSSEPGRPGPLSRICLGCHDGSTARDTFGDETGGLSMPARSRIGSSGRMGNDHPVGVRYPTGARKYQPLSRVEQGERIRLFDGKVECSSCHDPHNSYDQPYLLVMPNDESQLCTSCHRM